MWNGSDFQDRREAAGIPRIDLARALLVTETTIYRWESGRQAPHEVFRRALEDALDRLTNGKPVAR